MWQSILEAGAGTELITVSLADWTPSEHDLGCPASSRCGTGPAETFALEPSAGMRAVMLFRLNSRPELLDRVAAPSCDALSVELDESAGVAEMINVMYAQEPALCGLLAGGQAGASQGP